MDHRRRDAGTGVGSTRTGSDGVRVIVDHTPLRTEPAPPPSPAPPSPYTDQFVFPALIKPLGFPQTPASRNAHNDCRSVTCPSCEVGRSRAQRPHGREHPTSPRPCDVTLRGHSPQSGELEAWRSQDGRWRGCVRCLWASACDTLAASSRIATAGLGGHASYRGTRRHARRRGRCSPDRTAMQS